MAASKIIECLSRQGLPTELLSQATSDWRLRADLGLSSAETCALQLELEQAGCRGFALWDDHDYALAELEQLLLAAESSDAGRGGQTGPALAAGQGSPPWSLTALNQRLAVQLREGGDQLALIGGTRQFSYQALGASVATTVARLQLAGLRAGDRLAFQLGNGHAAVILLLAALLAGMVPVPILPGYRRHELRHILAKIRPQALALHAGNRRYSPLATAIELLRGEDEGPLLRLVDGAAPAGAAGWMALERFITADDEALARLDTLQAQPIDPTATAMVLLSSGTTGLPKPIERAAGGYARMIGEACKVFAVDRSSIYLAVMSVAHGFVLNCPGILGVLSVGGCLVLAADTAPATAMRLIATHAVSHASLVPALLAQWLDEAPRWRSALGSLRYLQVGGSRLDPALAARAEAELGLRLQQCYGMSEGLLCFTGLDEPPSIRHHAQGRPLLPEDELLIVDDQDRPLGCGETGELLTRGPYTIHRYMDDPAATARAFTPDGYYRTGDLAHLDRDGHVYIDGRRGEVINRAGEKFSPEEIEQLGRDHPRVADLACVGVADPQFGEVAWVFAVCPDQPALSLAELRGHLENTGLASFKLPERLVLLDALPRKGIGKVDRQALRELARQCSAEVRPAIREAGA